MTYDGSLLYNATEKTILKNKPKSKHKKSSPLKGGKCDPKICC